MSWLIAAIVGGIAGWLASMVMNRDASMGILANVLVGCLGSVIGNFFSRQFGIAGSVREFSAVGLAIAFAGAVLLLGVANLIQRGRVR